MREAWPGHTRTRSAALCATQKHRQELQRPTRNTDTKHEFQNHMKPSSSLLRQAVRLSKMCPMIASYDKLLFTYPNDHEGTLIELMISTISRY